MTRDFTGVPASRGLTFLKKFLAGERLSARQSILAECCTCMGFYVDGREDCEQEDCPLYPFYPYGKFRKCRTRAKPEAAA